MSLTTGLSRECTPRSGGVKAIWFANAIDIAEAGFATNGAGEYNAVTMESSKVFYKYEFEKDTAEVRENVVRENGSTKATHEVELFIAKLNKTNRNAIAQIIDASNCGIIAIVEDSNGTKWVLGYSESFRTKGERRTLALSSDASLGGKALTDLSGSTIILMSEDTEKARIYTGSIPV